MQAVQHTPLADRDALNHISRSAYEPGKTSKQRLLQREMYTQCRAFSHLPAHMACNVPRRVAATSVALWSQVKQHAALWKAGKTKKRDIGFDQAAKYVSSTPTYNDLQDDSFKPE